MFFVEVAVLLIIIFPIESRIRVLVFKNPRTDTFKLVHTQDKRILYAAFVVVVFCCCSLFLECILVVRANILQVAVVYTDFIFRLHWTCVVCTDGYDIRDLGRTPQSYLGL